MENKETKPPLKRGKKPAIVMTRFPYESSWGGEESHTLVLARHFRSLGYEVIFFGNCKVLLERFIKEGFSVRKVGGGKMIVTKIELIKSLFLSPFLFWNIRRHFRDLLKEYNVKAVYCLSLNEKLFLTGTAVQKNIPVTWVEHQEIRNWLIKNPWRWLYKKNSLQVKVVPISLKNKDVLINRVGVLAENIVEIVNGINLEKISKLARLTQKNLIVAANRFIPKKGIMDLLVAAKLLFDQGHNLELMIIGEGEEEDEIRKYIAENLADKKITVSGFLKFENWYEVLSKTDVYVSCARDSNETFSLSTAEALAAGCKVVVTTCSGIADYLEGRTEAFLAHPKDPVDLSHRIEEALDAPDTMRDVARQAAREKFDQSEMLKKYEKLILRKS